MRALLKPTPFAAAMVAIVLSLVGQPVAAAPSPGAPCTFAGSVEVADAQAYTCQSANGTLTWSKGLPFGEGLACSAPGLTALVSGVRYHCSDGKLWQRATDQPTPAPSPSDPAKAGSSTPAPQPSPAVTAPSRPPTVVVPKPGALCPKLKASVVYKGKTYTCVKVGAKKVWNKGVPVKTPVATKPTPTPAGNTCPVPHRTPVQQQPPNFAVPTLSTAVDLDANTSAERSRPVGVSRPAYTAANAPTFSLSARAETIRTNYPRDPMVTQSIEIRNGAQYADYTFGYTVLDAGGQVLNIASVPFPQGNHFLQPGETQRITANVLWDDLGARSWKVGSTHTFTIVFTVMPSYATSLAKTARLPFTVVVTDDPATGQTSLAADTKLSGCIYDAATNKAIADARIEFSTRFLRTDARSNTSGVYSTNLSSHIWVTSGTALPYQVRVSAPGYETTLAAVEPSGAALTLDLGLRRVESQAGYTLSKSVQTALNINKGVADAAGTTFAFVHFHSIIPPGANADAYVAMGELVVLDGAGAKLWSLPLKSESPAIAMTRDGARIATASARGAGADQGLYIMNRDGSRHWFYNAPGVTEFREVAFSADGKYLAAGSTDGDLFLIDVTTKQVLWRKFLNGQVRALFFDDAGSDLFASADDGYLTRFNLAGRTQWRTFLGSWLIAWDQSKDYIAAGPKVGGVVHLLGKDGKIRWSYATGPAAHEMHISPDEKSVLVVGTAGGTLNALFSIDGRLLSTRGQLEPVTFTADGRFLVVSGHTSAAGDRGIPWIAVEAVGGHRYWSLENLPTTIHRGPTGGFAWISSDAKRIVLASGEWIHFFTGSLK